MKLTSRSKKKPKHSKPVKPGKFKSKLEPSLSIKQILQKRMGILEKRVDNLETRSNKLGINLAKDFNILQQRTLLSWEVLWGLVAAFESKKMISVDELEAGRKFMVEKWHVEDVEKAKKELAKDQVLCEVCLMKDSFEAFSDAESETGVKCKRCGSTEFPFIHDEPEEGGGDDSESDKAVSES